VCKISQKQILSFISNKNLYANTNAVLKIIEKAAEESERKLYNNAIDPFSALFDVMSMNIKLSDWLEKEKLTNIKPSELTKEHIWDYKVFLSRHYKTRDGKQLKRVTQNFYLIALRSLLTFFADKDIPSLPPEKIKLTKQEEKPVHFLALDQVEKLLNEPKGKQNWIAGQSNTRSLLFYGNACC